MIDEVELAAFSVCCFPFGRKWSQSVARIIVTLVVLMLDISNSALATKAAVPRLAVVVGVLQQVLLGLFSQRLNVSIAGGCFFPAAAPQLLLCLLPSCSCSSSSPLPLLFLVVLALAHTNTRTHSLTH